MDNEDFDWRKASYSNGSGNCVEVGRTPHVVLVRDTTDREGKTLTFSPASWRAFMTGIKHS